MKDLKGKSAFVTGGSSGIGLGIVKVLAEEGLKVAFSYRRQDHLDQTMAYFRDKPTQLVHPIKVDVTDRGGLAAAKAEIERVYGPVQVLVNNAGVGIHGLMEQATFSDWDWVMSVNIGGVVNALVTFLPGMGPSVSTPRPSMPWSVCRSRCVRTCSAVLSACRSTVPGR